MVRFDIDEQQIRKIAELLHEMKLSEIEIVENDCRLRLVRALQPSEVTSVTSASDVSISSSLPPGPQEISPADLPPGTIFSPMVGTVYIAAESGSAPFVFPGHVVQVGQTVLIIEAMKVMNLIRATKAGTVTHIYVNDAQPVEYGEPLIVIE